MPLADRRCEARFEIVGDLWASLAMKESLRICNLGPSGALVEASAPLAVDSVHMVEVVHTGTAAKVVVKVRHVTAVSKDGGDQVFLIGLEFMQMVDGGDRLFERMWTGGTEPQQPGEA